MKRRTTTPLTDKLVEQLNVEPWLSTETKCKAIHAHALKLERENAKLRRKLKYAEELYEANHG